VGGGEAVEQAAERFLAGAGIGQDHDGGLLLHGFI
jgi:hypothetical protein